MDKYNVISPTNNLSDLEKDMTDWLLLSDDLRRASDDNCVRLYGMRNIDYYNKLKHDIIASQDKITNEDASFELFDLDDFEERLKSSKSLESPFSIVIIAPYKDKYNEYTLDDLNKKYNLFLGLSKSNRLLSNGYSKYIWGYTVYNMYNIQKSILSDKEDDEFEKYQDSDTRRMNDTNTIISESIDNMIFNKDILGLYNTKLSLYTENDSILKQINNNIFMDKISNAIDNKIISQNDLPYTNSWYSPDEVEYLSDNPITIDDPKQYYIILDKKIREYNSLDESDDKKKILEKEILSLGWNPSIDISGKSIKAAKNRIWNEYYKNRIPRIVDITNLNESSSELKDGDTNDKLFEKYNLYPIYIVCSFTDTSFAKATRLITRSEYTHAGISLDNKLNRIFTFKKGKDKHNDGFSIESKDRYNKSDRSEMCVICIFVDKKTITQFKKNLKFFFDNSDNTSYDYANLFIGSISHIPTKNNPQKLSMICSQFTDTILKSINISISGNRFANKTIPQDFYDRACKNPKAYKVFRGKITSFKPSIIANNIKKLFSNFNKKDISINNFNENGYNDTLNSINNLLIPDYTIIYKESANNTGINSSLIKDRDM